jgi:hypothetical protein
LTAPRGLARVGGGAAVRAIPKILLIVSLATLAMAANHFLFHWVLYADAMLRRWFFYV